MSNTLQLQPIKADFSLKDHIYAKLRDGIVSMDIYAKDADLRLEERRLSEQLGISRTPLREALSRLEQEGLVEILPRKGVFIRKRTLPEILEMIIVCAGLESMAARLAAQNASDAEIALLKEKALQDAQESYREKADEYSEANLEFHRMILDLSKCGMLNDIVSSQFDQIGAIRRRAIHEGGRLERSPFEHMQIVEAIEARDGDLASKYSLEHTMRLHDHVKVSWGSIAKPI